MVKSKDSWVVKVSCKSSNIEAVFENKGIWSSARHLLNNMPIEAVEAHYEERRKELERLTKDLADATLRNFREDTSYKLPQNDDVRLAELALKVNLGPQEKQVGYKKLKSLFFVNGVRSYGTRNTLASGSYVCEFDMLQMEVIQGEKGQVWVWKKLPLEKLAMIYTRPENSKRVIGLNRKHGLSVAITEIRKEYEHEYPQGLYGNK